jgi:hypothetical protein
LCQKLCGVGITLNGADGAPSEEVAAEYSTASACEKSQLIHAASKKGRLDPWASCAGGRFRAISVASGVAASRSFSWGTRALAVALSGAIMPAAAQQRLFVSSVSTPLALQSKAVDVGVVRGSIFIPLSSGVR